MASDTAAPSAPAQDPPPPLQQQPPFIVDWHLLPQQRCKVVHLIRHGQAEHNAAALITPGAYKEDRFFDCSLTQYGKEQARKLGARLQHSPPPGYSPVELVVCSTLLRALQTATEAFGSGQTSLASAGSHAEACAANGEGTPSGHRVADGASCGTAAPRFIATELCRESMHVHPCDRRLPISQHRVEFPHVDFSQVEDDEDRMWKAGPRRETREELALRARAFVHWLLARPESSIAVVSHSGFLRHFLWTTWSVPPSDTTSLASVSACPAKEDLPRSVYFDNCEIRSFTLAPAVPGLTDSK